MKLNSSMLVSLLAILLSTTLSFMSNNWLIMWILMEINLFMFIPLMSKNKINDQSIKYFIIQSFSSHLLIFSMLMSSILILPMKSSLLILTAMLIKIGMSPFHIWMPEIMAKMNWNECFMMSTVIKITPMILISKTTSYKLLMMPMILSLISGSVSGMNQFNLKKIMAFSSIFNISWMATSFFMSKKILFMFVMIYLTLTMKVMNFFKKKSILYKNQMNHLKMKEKLKINLIMLSLMGLPPLMGFLPKWMILKELMHKSNLLSWFMILTSMMSIFMYIQVNSNYLTNFSLKKKNIKNVNMISFKLINVTLIVMCFMIWID
uniref:NADH-ubiquinone oxidoreductase chain 2 n=1 Tax=Epeurysa nawaii TaxID=1308479 RepID=A0A7S4YZE5_9HEMI|nr:NADH dehydrogenase subunit 2 [Epeurysa nawaii]QBZ37991.1 NADH dehydrogenase subunit 2 [Epeurysa nawaii]QBZ38004.1 NADH dehydrogenase subunit 2 [Epeurysa nawaii]